MEHRFSNQYSASKDKKEDKTTALKPVSKFGRGRSPKQGAGSQVASRNSDITKKTSTSVKHYKDMVGSRLQKSTTLKVDKTSEKKPQIAFGKNLASKSKQSQSRETSPRKIEPLAASRDSSLHDISLTNIELNTKRKTPLGSSKQPFSYSSNPNPIKARESKTPHYGRKRIDSYNDPSLMDSVSAIQPNPADSSFIS
jgi:hypothetical protein